MKRLLTLYLLLITTFSLTAFASISMGHVQPVSKAVRYWHLADCVPPCWAGITLDATSPVEAMRQITRLFSDFEVKPPSQYYQSWERNNDLAGGRRIILLQSRSGFASNITIGGDYPDSMPTLGELITLFGAPTCLIVNTRSGQAKLYYDDSSGQQMLEIGVVRPAVTAPVQYVWMTSASILSCQKIPVASWRGFRSAELYVADVK